MAFRETYSPEEYYPYAWQSYEPKLSKVRPLILYLYFSKHLFCRTCTNFVYELLIDYHKSHTVLTNVARVAEATAGLNGPIAGARVQSAAGGAAALQVRDRQRRGLHNGRHGADRTGPRRAAVARRAPAARSPNDATHSRHRRLRNGRTAAAEEARTTRSIALHFSQIC